LCTEAALNAVQRRYPQIYKSEERLLLKPETIDVGLRDFMISVKSKQFCFFHFLPTRLTLRTELVPSSARSASSAASPLPTQLVPLLEETFQKTKDVIARVLPVEKKLSALEEAEFEDYEGEEGALHREMMQQCMSALISIRLYTEIIIAMNTLRVYRPRMLLHGAIGMGQSYIGAAALHQLEGFHIQSLELGALMSDSTRVCFHIVIPRKATQTITRLLRLLLFNCLWKPRDSSHQSSISQPSSAGVPLCRKLRERLLEQCWTHWHLQIQSY